MIMRTVRYSSLTSKDLQELYDKLNPENNNLYPSVVLDWSNEEDKAFAIIGDDWVLGSLSPIEWDPFWSLSSKRPLSEKTLNEIIATVKNIDPATNYINNVTPITLEGVSPSSYKIDAEETDSDNFIYDTRDIANCQGSKFSDMRRYTKQFEKFSPTISWLGADQIQDHKAAILAFHASWHEAAATDGAKLKDHESRALQNFFVDEILDKKTLPIVAVFVDANLVGVAINEILPDGFSFNHYFKADSNFKGSGVYLFHEINKGLLERGVHTLNYQEDLGIPGLRSFKEKMRPTKKAGQIKIAI
jgi:hypothetical protein